MHVSVWGHVCAQVGGDAHVSIYLIWAVHTLSSNNVVSVQKNLTCVYYTCTPHPEQWSKFVYPLMTIKLLFKYIPITLSWFGGKADQVGPDWFWVHL